MGAPTRHILPVSLAVAAVWLGAQCVVWAAHRAPRHKMGFAVFHGLWFYGVPVAGALGVAFGMLPASVFGRVPYFSPWGLWWFLRDLNAAAHPALWLALGAHALVALAGGAWAWRVGRDQISTVAAPEAVEVSAQIAALAPQTAQASPIPTMSAAATVRLSRKPLAAPDAWLARVLNWLARFDNPLLILETRRALLGVKLSFLARFIWFVEALFAAILLVLLPLVSALGGPSVGESAGSLLAIMLAIFAGCIVGTTSGANMVYDRDRLDGSLEMLFLAPLSETEIARGKVGPFLVRALLMTLALLPLWALGLAFCPTADQLPLTVAYLVAPFWVFALVVRGAVGGHWLALKKRKIGPGGTSFWVSLGVAATIVVEIGGLGALAVAIAETWFSAPIILAALLVTGAFYALETRWLWARGRRELRAWRLHGAPGAK